MPEAPTRRRFRHGDEVTVIGVPSRPEPAPGVVKMVETPPMTEGTPAAKRPRKKATAKQEHPVTVRKVALGVNDLAPALYKDALARVGGDPKKLYRVKVLSPSRYEIEGS